MNTHNKKQTFEEEFRKKLLGKNWWLIAGVASSIPWPSLDQCIEYAGEDYFLRGSDRDGKPSPPGITIACDKNNTNATLSKMYKFTSILSWFIGGYVDVSGYICSSAPGSTYDNLTTVYSTLGIAWDRPLICNNMPIIKDDNVRKALAFWREGKRLEHVHCSYSFLSFYKVIESQFLNTKEKKEWISSALDKLTDDAEKRVIELRNTGIDVNKHLYESGRCAVAHASLERQIIDPDIASDRQRLASDLIIVKELAKLFISEELKVPTLKSLYRSRNKQKP
jgi:hypothetical protein